MVSRQRRTARKAMFHQQGWRSTNPVDPVNQQQFPGLESAPVQELEQWEDLPERAHGARSGRKAGVVKSTGETSPGIPESFQERTGVSYRQIRERTGGYLDRAMQRAHAEGRDIPEGQDWYATERNRVAERSRNWGVLDQFSDPQEVMHLQQPKGRGVPPETALSMVAATSPQVAWYEEPSNAPEGRYPNIDVAERVAYQEENPTQNPLSVPTGTVQNALKAAAIHAGEDPNEVLGGKKVRSFNQNLQRPSDPRNRATVDVHTIQAQTGLEKEAAEQALAWKGSYELADRAIQSQARARGIAPDEAQAVIWHQRKHEIENPRQAWRHGRTQEAPQEETLFNADQFSRQRRR